MEIKGLQLNDLAYYCNKELGELYCKIYSLSNPYPRRSERFNNKLTADIFVGDGMLSVTEDELSPIPITIEFLKKNGFKQDEGVEAEEYVLYGDWGRMFYVPEWKGFYIMRGDGLINFYAVVEYVHEIQHLMRDAKLDDIADNLKC